MNYSSHCPGPHRSSFSRVVGVAQSILSSFFLIHCAKKLSVAWLFTVVTLHSRTHNIGIWQRQTKQWKPGFHFDDKLFIPDSGSGAKCNPWIFLVCKYSRRKRTLNLLFHYLEYFASQNFMPTRWIVRGVMIQFTKHNIVLCSNQINPSRSFCPKAVV